MNERLAGSSTVVSSYVNSNLIMPASNVCEWPIWTARFARGERREILHPVNYEVQLFSKVNATHWSSTDDSETVYSNSTWSASKHILPDVEKYIDFVAVFLLSLNTLDYQLIWQLYK